MTHIIVNHGKTIVFVLIDGAGAEVSGIGNGFTVELSKDGAAFIASAGAKSEIGSGWYKYVMVDAEADTFGPLAVKITAPGAIQQNLLYEVVAETGSGFGAIAFDYTVTSSLDSSPIEGVNVWATTDIAGLFTVASGVTDSFGQVTFYLDAGIYYIWRAKSGYTVAVTDDDNPEMVTVS